MEQRDALGRRRHPAQDRGLRPLYPLLPESMESRSVRIAMSPEAWRRLEELLAASDAPTTPRALGELLERALGSSREPELWAGGPAASVADWQEWQIRKERGLLGRRGDEDEEAMAS